jgi:putative endonuclease
MLGWLYRRFDHIRHKARARRWPDRQALGRRGEDLAHRLLERHGYVVVERNWRTRDGLSEVDIIAWDGPTLAFVEVKTRASDEHAAPERAIDQVKRMALQHAALLYARIVGVAAEQVRFDLVSVVHGPRPALRLVRGSSALRGRDEVS